MPFKNTAVKVTIIAWDTINNVGKTGDQANITVRGVGDGTEYTPSAPNVTQVDATNLKGVYSVELTAAENNYSFNTIGGNSSTANIVIIPISWVNELQTGDSYSIVNGDHGLVSIQDDIDSIKTTVELVEDINRNKMTIVDATGAVTLYADDSTTPLLTTTLTDDSTTTIRPRLS